jgi:hypothetical protein
MKGPVKSSPSPQAKHRGLEPMEYQNGNGHAIRMAMTGASLAHRLRRMTAAQRACSAADVDDGKVALVDLTAKSIAALHQVSLPYMQAAKKLSPAERDQVRRGERPLVPARPRAAPEAAPFDWLDDAAFIEVIRQIGVDRTLDAAIRRV